MKFRLLSKVKNFFFRFFRGPALSDINIAVIGGGMPAINIGSHTYINKARLYCWKPGLSLNVGAYCSMAEDVSFILGGEHDVNWVSTYPFIERWKCNDLLGKATNKSRGDINIESDVWIGHGVTLLSGSNIGVGAIIGAGAVVRGDIPPYSIAVGVPAKVVKKRFSEEICRELLESKWWLLEKEQLIQFIDHFDDPIKFLAAIKDFNEQK